MGVQEGAVTLFFDHSGPMILYAGGVLRIEDLNPEKRIRWRMSRWEMLWLGLRCVAASVRVRP